MRNNPLLSTILGLLLTSTAVVSPSPAHATTFAEMSTEQFTDASTYIVRGEVLEVWTEVDDNDHIWTRARVQVRRTLKGPDAPTELIVDSLGGEHGSQRLVVPGQARFSIGEDVFLFLALQGNGRLVPVSKFLGKYVVRRAPGERREYAMTWHPRDRLHTYDGRFIPHPEPSKRVYIDDLLNVVDARLEQGWDGEPIPGLSPERLHTINTPERRVRR